MIRKLVIGAVAAIAVIAGSSPAFAIVEESDRNAARGAVKQVEPTTSHVAGETTTGDSQTKDATAAQKEEIESRKAEFRERLAQKAHERKEKLDGRRLAQCENRQQRINALIDKTVTNGRTQLGNIQRVEARVAEFYAKKELSSTEYDAALAEADQAEAEAIAVLDVMAAQDFDCQAVDGAKPSETLRTTHQTKKSALQAYRQSVVELIKVTKRAFVAQEQGVEDAQN